MVFTLISLLPRFPRILSHLIVVLSSSFSVLPWPQLLALSRIVERHSFVNKAYCMPWCSCTIYTAPFCIRMYETNIMQAQLFKLQHKKFSYFISFNFNTCAIQFLFLYNLKCICYFPLKTFGLNSCFIRAKCNDVFNYTCILYIFYNMWI